MKMALKARKELLFLFCLRIPTYSQRLSKMGRRKSYVTNLFQETILLINSFKINFNVKEILVLFGEKII